jgi:hypothetical protein
VEGPEHNGTVSRGQDRDVQTTLVGRGETASVTGGRDRVSARVFSNPAPTGPAMRMVKTAFAKPNLQFSIYNFQFAIFSR